MDPTYFHYIFTKIFMKMLINLLGRCFGKNISTFSYFASSSSRPVAHAVHQAGEPMLWRQSARTGRCHTRAWSCDGRQACGEVRQRKLHIGRRGGAHRSVGVTTTVEQGHSVATVEGLHDGIVSTGDG